MRALVQRERGSAANDIFSLCLGGGPIPWRDCKYGNGAPAGGDRNKLLKAFRAWWQAARPEQQLSGLTLAAMAAAACRWNLQPSERETDDAGASARLPTQARLQTALAAKEQ
ncbi:hypothetical protein PHYPSEUDO_000181 [Phytophthora pseudosyringae]|uniref:Uncharacterized protein n=1 Tax=Phytophthora pseudosyringae TaxID=221518 RepID=A0A8T1WKL4_9STRA|nr:hypothetical protein PHYPSEUDO_000181 [Phytophthora pseudosyringae]